MFTADSVDGAGESGLLFLAGEDVLKVSSGGRSDVNKVVLVHSVAQRITSKQEKAGFKLAATVTMTT